MPERMSIEISERISEKDIRKNKGRNNKKYIMKNIRSYVIKKKKYVRRNAGKKIR